MGSACLCWILSVNFHTFRCYSKTILRRAECFDYCGILCFALSAFLPIVYNLFLCDIFLQVICQYFFRNYSTIGIIKKIYMGGLTFTGIMILFLINWEPFSRLEYRLYRTMTFSSMSLLLFVSLIHASIKVNIIV